MYDWLIVGAGFAGSVLAERLANQRNERVLIIDRRPHIGGNAYDRYDEAGLLIHQYGPHIFHTNAKQIFDHLSQFTEWRPYEHRVLAEVDGLLLPIPINLDTVNKLYRLNLTSEELEEWFASRAEHVDEIKTSEDVVVSKVGRELYEKFFRGYTRKQWGLDPSELDKSVTARVPTRTNRDDRYFTDEFQDFRFGKLPYRSLSFKHVTLDQGWFQPVGTVNYPQTEAYTRISEYKHLTGQEHPRTTITYEYPSAEGDPYYPVPKAENQELFKRYEKLALATPDVWFVGRLATYRYYNMDQIVGQALATFRRINEALPVGADTSTVKVMSSSAGLVS